MSWWADHWLLNVNMLVGIATMLVAFFIFFKATIAYRQSGDRGMLLLGIGLLLLVVAPTPVAILGHLLVEPQSAIEEMQIRLFQTLTRFAGITTILASIYVRP